MANFIFEIRTCRVSEIRFKSNTGNFMAGKLSFKEGSIDFEEDFQTTQIAIIDTIEAYPHAEFSVAGFYTKNPGKGKGEGRFFKSLVVESIKVLNKPETDVDAGVQEDDEIPF